VLTISRWTAEYWAQLQVPLARGEWTLEKIVGFGNSKCGKKFPLVSVSQHPPNPGKPHETLCNSKLRVSYLLIHGGNEFSHKCPTASNVWSMGPIKFQKSSTTRSCFLEVVEELF
jgi:hypothetical protein